MGKSQRVRRESLTDECSRELERHGLDTEKLDKWEELVSARASSKTKRGRKTM